MQVAGEGSKWDLLSAEQSIFHDDGIGKAELRIKGSEPDESPRNIMNKQ